MKKAHAVWQTHTADIKLLVSASSIPGLFYESLKAVNEFLHPTYITPKTQTQPQTLTITAKNELYLLIDFLSTIVAYSTVYHAVFEILSIDKQTEKELIVTIQGTRTEEFEEEIKAVTYHQASLEKTVDNQYCATIIFDI